MASKELIYAVMKKDYNLLKYLLDSELVFDIHIPRSVNIPTTAFQYAILDNNIEMVKLFINYMKNSKLKNRPAPTIVVENNQEDNALAYDRYHYKSVTDIEANLASFVIQHENISKDILKLLISNFPLFRDILCDEIGMACVYGNLNIAKFIVKKLSTEKNQISLLHKQVLGSREAAVMNFLKSDYIRSETITSPRLTPIQMSAINPNFKLLQLILEKVQDIDITDDYNRTIVHYAAACNSSAPLEYLFKKFDSIIPYTNEDDYGITPLMVASMRGRLDNVKVLIEREEKDKMNQRDNKYIPYLKTLDLPQVDILDHVKGWSAFHYAIANNSIEILQYFLKKDVNN